MVESSSVKTSFFIVSCGPMLDEIQPIAHVFYDASNGVISRGRIYQPVTGNRTSGYPYTTGQYPGITLADFGCANTCE